MNFIEKKILRETSLRIDGMTSITELFSLYMKCPKKNKNEEETFSAILYILAQIS